MSQQNILIQTFLQTIDSLEKCQALTEKMDEVLKQRCNTIKNRVASHYNENAPFRVAFCGVFSSGKSSLINCLLQCEYKLPTGVIPITKIVTRIKYGQELSCFYLDDKKAQKLNKQKTLRIIRGDEVLPKGCSEVTLEIPAEILKENVEFIDTPGFNDEMGGELEYMSRRAMANADMVILCCSSLQLGKMLERELITELESIAGNFCMAVTRMDCLNTEEDIQEIKRKAGWLMRGRGNLAMLSNAAGRYFTVVCAGRHVMLDGLDKYLKKILCCNEKRSVIRGSTDMLGMISTVADLIIDDAQDYFGKRLKEQIKLLNDELNVRLNQKIQAQEKNLHDTEEKYKILAKQQTNETLDIQKLEEECVPIIEAASCIQNILNQEVEKNEPMVRNRTRRPKNRRYAVIGNTKPEK